MESILEQKEISVGASNAVKAEKNYGEKIARRVRFQLRSFYLMGTRVDNIDSNLACRIISHYITEKETDSVRKIFFSNVHSICTAQQDWILKQCLNLGDLVLPDGSGLKIGGKVTGNPIIENLNGTDFTPKIIKMAEEKGWSVFFLGAEQSVVQQCCERIRTMYPKLQIAGFRNGYFTPDEEKTIIEQINTVQPDILLVAFGTPKQELWLTRYAHELNAKVALAVGGLFDFLSMTKKRAPLWMRVLGIEWLFRFFYEPKAKWKRIIIEIPMYCSMLAAEKFIPKTIRRRIQKAIFS